MPNHEHIYENEAEQYELLISREDCEGRILQALLPIRSFHSLDVIDLGAGSGRLACLLAPYAKSIVAIDGSQAMLDVAAAKLRRSGYTNWQTIAADHRDLPVPDQSADVVVAGWTICYVANSNVEEWQQQLQKVMREIGRVLRPGGTVIILETMGTGYEEPSPPHFLPPYFEQLEKRYGFTHRWIRTDFQFASVGEAERLCRFFFGDELADKVDSNQWSRVPSCTGIWYKHNYREDIYDTTGGAQG